MSVEPRALLDDLAGRLGQMRTLLDELVSCESPSDDPRAQDAVRAVLRRELDAVGLVTRTVPGRGTGDHLLARERRGRDGRRPHQLVLGHFDTVWPLGTTASAPAADGRGPGSFDMKAGLVQLIGALHALRATGAELPLAPVVFLNADEEIGSPDSRRWIDRLARVARRAFVLEGAYGPDGALKVGRKGVGRYVLRVHGRAAHAGLDPGAGVSAVLELSHQVQNLFALNDPDRGVTVNVGTIDGGLRPNVVAPEATAHIDVRAFTAADAMAVDAAIRALTPVNEGTTLDVEGGFDRPPMERTPGTERLWQRAEAIAAQLGMPLRAAVVGGASDGNLASRHTPTLDGLGAQGDGAHRTDEHVDLDAMPARAALLAALLASPPDDEEVDP